ncbi:hypothetical protein [Mycobacterium marinum]|uniref:hypothetical protein n=1 Tax=Mycobacterium marinum TaxID=1781 RepID=UPI00056F1E2B|nr:hypothetical protein [Mycobacterium marinum]
MPVAFCRPNARINTRNEVHSSALARSQLGGQLHQYRRLRLTGDFLLPQPAKHRRAVSRRGGTVDDLQFLLGPLKILTGLATSPLQRLVKFEP